MNFVRIISMNFVRMQLHIFVTAIRIKLLLPLVIIFWNEYLKQCDHMTTLVTVSTVSSTSIVNLLSYLTIANYSKTIVSRCNYSAKKKLQSNTIVTIVNYR